MVCSFPGLARLRHPVAGSLPIAVLGLLLGAVPGFGQTSFDAEVADPRRVELSFDFMGSVDRHAAGGFEWYLPDVAVGLGRGLQVGTAWSTTVSAAPGAHHEWHPHAKWRFVERDRFAIAAATAWHLPTGGESDPYGLFQVSASGTLDDGEALWVSAGLYRLVRGVPDEGTRYGVALGFERALARGWALNADWVSGGNWYGYLSVGATYARGRQSVYGGYCVGNRPAANHGPCVTLVHGF